MPTALFLSVYLGSMAAAARALHGPARWAAVPATLAVIVMLAYCGWSLAIPAIVALAVIRHHTVRHDDGIPGARARPRGLATRSFRPSFGEEICHGCG